MTSRPSADFAKLYDQADANAYFQALAGLDYRLPAAMTRLIGELGAEIAARGGPDRFDVVDFACGYGALGAMLRFGLDVGALSAGIPPGPAREAPSLMIAGVDIAPNALAYAQGARFIDQAFCVDLMTQAPGPELSASLGRCDMIVEVGSFHSVFARCLAPMLDAAGDRPMVLFSPRPDADPRAAIAVLEERGYALLSWGGAPLPYRRFLDDAEEATMRADASAWSREAEAQLHGGWIHNRIHVAAPRAHPWRDAAATVCSRGWPAP